MAVDPKTGKPVPELTMDLPADPAEAAAIYEFLRETERLMRDAERGMPGESDVPPPNAGPRGTSLPRGAYGPWLAAQGWAKAEAKRRP